MNYNHKPDYILFILASSLIGISILFSYSLSVYTVIYFDYNQSHFFLRQLLTGSFAIIIMYILAHIDPDWLISRLGWVLFAFFLAMAFMPFLPSSMVTQSGGAARWIRFPGFSLSPVEFFKIGFIYFLSNSFHRILIPHTKVKLVKELQLLIPYGIVFLVVIFFVAILQKDLGQVVLLGIVFIIMLLFANRSYKVFLSLLGSIIMSFIILILIAPHRILRIQSWWSGVQDNMLSLPFIPKFIEEGLRVKTFPEAYQIGHSLNAIYHGGMNGTGIGEGALKLGFLSEVHTDFVISGIVEEVGLLGFMFIVVLFFFMIIRIFKTSRRVDNIKYHLFSLGIGLVLVISFLINAYGISGLVPIKGIAVPFISYGGSSLLSSAIAVGMVLSISQQAK